MSTVKKDALDIAKTILSLYSEFSDKSSGNIIKDNMMMPLYYKSPIGELICVTDAVIERIDGRNCIVLK